MKLSTYKQVAEQCSTQAINYIIEAVSPLGGGNCLRAHNTYVALSGGSIVLVCRECGTTHFLAYYTQPSWISAPVYLYGRVFWEAYKLDPTILNKWRNSREAS